MPMVAPKVLAMVLAGGESKRLAPLTADRAKPAVPFGGDYRLIDFALSNLVNAGYLRIVVLTQYKSHSLDKHIAITWRMSPLLGNYVTPVPAQMRRGRRWYAGSSDAIFQSLNLIHDERPDYVIVFGADHIYRMDPRQMVEQHAPSLVARGDAEVYDFAGNEVPGTTDRDHGYWRDVGTLDAYYDAHKDLISVQPLFNLYNDRWPILTWHEPLPPAKFVLEAPGSVGQAIDSMVCAGVIVSGGTVRRSVLSPGVRVREGALVEDSVVMHDVDVGVGAVVRRAIVDKNVQVPEDARIGVDHERDRERFAISDGGVVVIGKGQKIEA